MNLELWEVLMCIVAYTLVNMVFQWFKERKKRRQG